MTSMTGSTVDVYFARLTGSNPNMRTASPASIRDRYVGCTMHKPIVRPTIGSTPNFTEDV